MGVQACRLPSLKRLKPCKTLKTLKTLTTRHGGPSLPFAMLHPAANRHPKATYQWLLIGVQACRLPALKRLKPLKTLQTLKTLTTRHGGPSLPFARPARPHINGFLWASKPAVCQALKTFPWHASSCSQQAPQGHTSMSSYGRPSLPFASP